MIRDLNIIHCGNRENDKSVDRIRDLTVLRKAGLTKIGHGMQIYVCMSDAKAGNCHDPPVLAAKANQPGEH